MENLSDEIKMKMLKSIDPNELPKELLIEILKEQELENKEKQQMLIDLDAIEKCLREKVNKLEDLLVDHDASDKIWVDRVNELEEELEEQIKINIELQKQKDENLENIYRGDPMIVTDANDEELLQTKKSHYDRFLNKYCKWTNQQKKVFCSDTKKYYHVAPESAQNVFDSFKNWAVNVKIIPNKHRGNKNVPTKKEFFEWLERDHKSRYPDDWVIKDHAFPRSPNGSYVTPRINLIINTKKLREKGLN